MASGSVHPSCSANSRPSVFFPSIRYGSRSVETSTAPVPLENSRAAIPQSPIWPSTSCRSAPKARICLRIGAGVVVGAYTLAWAPARVAYAASAIPALPAVGTTNWFAPAPTARVIAAASPRALNDPVGLVLSSFTQSCWNPWRAPRRAAASSGVPPSPSVTGCSSSASGSQEP